MKLIIKFCKNCPNNTNCEYKNNIKKLTQSVKGVTALINVCPIYKKLFHFGEYVSFGTKEQIENSDKNHPMPFVWIDAPKARGRITGILSKNGLFKIKLKESLYLKRYNDDKFTIIKLDYYWKYPSEIKRIIK